MKLSNKNSWGLGEEVTFNLRDIQISAKRSKYHVAKDLTGQANCIVSY